MTKAIILSSFNSPRKSSRSACFSLLKITAFIAPVRIFSFSLLCVFLIKPVVHSPCSCNVLIIMIMRGLKVLQPTHTFQIFSPNKWNQTDWHHIAE